MIYLHPAAARSEEEAVWAQRMVTLRRMILTPSLIAVWLARQSAGHEQRCVGPGMAARQAAGGRGADRLSWLDGRQSKRMAKGERPLTDRQLRLWGEAPAFGLIFIVVLVIVGPAYLN